MLIEQTLEKLYKMKLYGMHSSVKEKLSKPENADLSFTDMLGILIDDEWIYRENKRMNSRLRNAKFKQKQACIENVTYFNKRGLKKTQVLELAKNQWIENHQNIILTGLSGSGKSYIAQALGNNACRYGFTVHYIRLSRLLFNLLKSRAEGIILEYFKKLSKYDLLIIDDFGISAMDEQAKADLLEIAEDRYSARSTILTSQLPISDWHPYLGGGLVADAILDRLIHNAYKITLNTIDSLRKVDNKLILSHEGQE